MKNYIFFLIILLLKLPEYCLVINRYFDVLHAKEKTHAQTLTDQVIVPEVYRDSGFCEQNK